MHLEPEYFHLVPGYTVAQEFAESVKIINFEPCEEEASPGVYFPDAVELEVKVKQKFYYQLSDALAHQGLDLDFHPKFTNDENNVVTATYFVE